MLQIKMEFFFRSETLCAPDDMGITPIYIAAYNGHTEIVKILATLTDNPNAPDEYGFTPIHCAARNGCTEIVKILALTLQGNLERHYMQLLKRSTIRKILL